MEKGKAWLCFRLWLAANSVVGIPGDGQLMRELLIVKKSMFFSSLCQIQRMTEARNCCDDTALVGVCCVCVWMWSAYIWELLTSWPFPLAFQSGSYDVNPEGMTTFTGKTPSRYSYLVQGHVNPYFLPGDEKKNWKTSGQLLMKSL